LPRGRRNQAGMAAISGDRGDGEGGTAEDDEITAG
jgi:hypothetical protein